MLVMVCGIKDYPKTKWLTRAIHCVSKCCGLNEGSLAGSPELTQVAARIGVDWVESH